jgi:hypothetical protein
MLAHYQVRNEYKAQSCHIKGNSTPSFGSNSKEFIKLKEFLDFTTEQK